VAVNELKTGFFGRAFPKVTLFLAISGTLSLSTRQKPGFFSRVEQCRMNELAIAPLEHRDIPAAARVLSLAMLSCPIHLAVFQGQDDKVRREQEWMFITLLRRYPGLVFVSRLAGQIVGVLRMKSCHGGRASGRAADEEALQDRAARVSHWQNVWAYHDPMQPHWHLGPVGVVPSHQGSGVGTALMRHFCHEVDARQAAAYLETDRSENVRFYQKFGFKPVNEIDIFDVKNYLMWRPSKESTVK
jgi:ribosomal protein S18 acetylase RimI-like enzyme